MIKALNNYKLMLLLVFALALVLRVFSLDTIPPSLNWDEISHGYNAFSVLKTGSDEWGKFLPITNFRAYGDYPLPLNLYLLIPFEAVLGLTAFSIRLPHALLGSLLVFPVYYLSLAVFKKKQTALISSLLVAVTPWYVFTSRFVLQSNLAVFFLISAFALFFNRQKNKYFLPLSIVSVGLTLFSYHSTRIFTPLLVLPVIVLYRKEILSKLNVFLFLLFFLPLPFILMNPEARARSNEVFLLNPNIVYKIEVERNSSTLPQTFKRLVYNRPVYLAINFSKNYVEYFSPKFLFTEGGTQYQFSVPHNGLLYLFELPFFYLGLLLVVKNAIRKRDKNMGMILSWLLLSPIPASLTTEHFAVIRATTMQPIPSLLVAYGLYVFYTYIQKKYKVGKKILISLFGIILALSVVNYLSLYFGSYTKDYSWAWQYGYKDVVNYATSHYDDYDKIIVTKKYGEPHEFFLFYTSWSPEKYKNDPNLIRFNQSNWWWVDSFDKFIFVNDWQIPKDGNIFITESKHEIDCTSIRCLLVTSPGNTPNNWGKVKTVNFLDDKPAFEIYEN